MGLDVYLYRYGSKEEYEAVLASKDEEDHGQSIERDSAKHPKHMFKIGYFRSSYNETGFNHVASDVGCPGLYEIFGVERDNYYVLPNWKLAIERAREAQAKLKAFVEANGSLSVSRISHMAHPKTPGCSEDAMRLFLETKAQHEKEGAKFDFSNIAGLFHVNEPLTVLAAIPGFAFHNDQCTYLIVKDKGDFEWYLEALDVVAETCEWVLAEMAKPANTKAVYALHWSG